MGVVENESRKKKRKNLQKSILSAVALAGVLGVGLLLPNILQSLKTLGMLPGRRQKESINSARKRLIQKGLIRYRGGFLELTPSGELELRRMELTDYQIKKPKKWDQRWRVLIFDIPEKKRRVRDKIRSVLASVGFIRLQDSVWLYPYDCEEVVMLLKSDLRIGKDVLYLVVEALEHDVSYRKAFNLA